MNKKVLILTLLLIATGLFWHCSEEIHDNAVTFGVKHKKPQIKHLKGAEAKLVMNQLEKKVSKSKLRILGKAGTYARSNEGTIDYSEIMQVKDTLGNTNYTFRIINHPDDSNLVYHNLVVKMSDEDDVKINLLKYTNIYFQESNIFNNQQIESNILITSLSSNDCDPLPIIVNPIQTPNPIGGGGSDAGGGYTGGGSFGGGSTGGTGSNGSINEIATPVFQCNSCSFNANSWDDFKVHTDENGVVYSFTVNLKRQTNSNTTNSGLQTDPCLPDGTIGVLLPDFLIQFYDSLSQEQKTKWDNISNYYFKEKVIYFLASSQNYESAFNHFWQILELHNQNPSFYTYERILSWFLTPREGKDIFSYDEDFWENNNLSFQPQSLPTWNNFNNSFPRVTGSELVELVGGAIKTAYNQYPELSRGYCALKVSRALNYSGIVIPNIISTSGNPGTIQGGDGKYYFLNAKALNKWLKITFGTNPASLSSHFNNNHYHFNSEQGGPNGVNFENLITNIVGLKGIYSMVSTNSNWASGHADLINSDGICLSGCHLSDIPPAPIDFIDIWILN